ncbi:MAG TPA: hypothetical protein VIQ77_00300 [Mucilaginibacter sp.]|jgi:hypothetical protein
MEAPVKDQLKKLRFSAFINAAMAVYAVCMFLSALQTHVAWRIFVSGFGSVFFIAATVVIVLRMIKLLKQRHLQS